MAGDGRSPESQIEEAHVYDEQDDGVLDYDDADDVLFGYWDNAPEGEQEANIMQGDGDQEVARRHHAAIMLGRMWEDEDDEVADFVAQCWGEEVTVRYRKGPIRPAGN